MGSKPYILPCLAQIPVNHRQQVVHLAISDTDSKSWSTNRTSCHASHLYQPNTDNKSYFLPVLTQISELAGNKSYLLPCLRQIPANHRQQIVLLAMSHVDTSKSQATNRTSCHVSRRHQQITSNRSYFLPCLAQIPANHRQQIVLLAMSHADTNKKQATNRASDHA